MIEYIPINRSEVKTIASHSSWGDIPTILKDIIDRFNIGTNTALEFGVEYGYSASALANYFKNVIGVDTFLGDVYSGIKSATHFEEAKNNLKIFKNITLIQSDYKDFIEKNNNKYDLVHIDIVHDYNETYECGEWAVNHSDLVIFHDTQSFPTVFNAVTDLADKYSKNFYEYKLSNGLGILTDKKI